ncbi:hypothetical protein CRI65_21170 [Escherichia sp. E3659]|nr:hypothetical protein CRI65_21170 [Escherichia sp. E3659]
MQKSKKPARKQAFLNLAPLTGSSVAINWLIGKLKQKIEFVKTTRLTTFCLNDTGSRFIVYSLRDTPFIVF